MAQGSGMVVDTDPVQVVLGLTCEQRAHTINLLLAANAADEAQIAVPHVSTATPERRRPGSAESAPDTPLEVTQCRVDLAPPRGDLVSSYGPVAGKTGCGARALPYSDKGDSDEPELLFREGAAAGSLGQ